MLKSSLCEYSYTYILLKGTITVTGNAGPEPDANSPKDTAQLLVARKTDEKNEAKDVDILIPMYTLIEYSNNCSKRSRSLWQYYRDEPNDN